MRGFIVLIVFLCLIQSHAVVFVDAEMGVMCYCGGGCQNDTTICETCDNKRRFGPVCQFRDITDLPGVQANQTTTKEEAEKAIDEDGCSKTDGKLENQYWAVRFPKNQTVTELSIRTKDDKKDNFKNFVIYVEYVEEFNDSDSFNITKQQVCFNRSSDKGADKEMFAIKCESPLTGNQVKIQLKNEKEKMLVLCEVNIIGDECSEKFYGENCTERCGNCHDGCDKTTGECLGGCSAGYVGDNCTKDCDDGRYGNACNYTCGHCYNSTCDKVTGNCTTRCSAGYAGETCQTELFKQFLAGTSIPVFIGSGIFFILGLLLIILFDYMGRRKKRIETETVQMELMRRNNEERRFRAPMRSKRFSMLRDRFRVEENTRVQLSNLLQQVKSNFSSKGYMDKQFESIPCGAQYATTSATLPENIGKNRHKEIVPYEHSRVQLSAIQGVEGSDYINASYINGHLTERAYIAAQAPSTATLDDFWRMIWERDVRTIVMLTSFVEEMKAKCIQYWGPPNSTMTCKDLTIDKDTELVFAEYTVRRFRVCRKKNRDQERIVTQFHYTAWPDKGVPRCTTSLVQFWNVVRQADSTKLHSWLVHCSAGVGRTGTFIAMDILNDEGEEMKSVDIKQCVKKLREQRVNMVQTKEQYNFLHGLVVELLVFPSKPTQLDEFSSVYSDLKAVDEQANKAKLLLQYERVQDEIDFVNLVYECSKLPTSDKERFAAAKLDVIKTKNRFKSPIPPNEFRPILSSSVPGSTSYLNALYIQSYFSLRGLIVTQTPLTETAADYGRLVIEKGVKVIVTLDYDGKGKENVSYLPKMGSIQLGPLSSTHVSEVEKRTYIQRTYKLVYNTEESVVYQFIFKNWTSQHASLPEIQSVFSFMETVDLANRKAAGKSIMVQCQNGTDRSGLFVVLMNIMDHVRYENRVSIPLLVRSAKIRREQIVSNFEQYKYCYDAVFSFVEGNLVPMNL